MLSPHLMQSSHKGTLTTKRVSSVCPTKRFKVNSSLRFIDILTMAVRCCVLVLVGCLTFATAGPCATPNSTEGECINIDDCPQLQQLQETLPLTKKTASFLHKSQCGYEGTVPKVCCPKSNLPRPFVIPPQVPNFGNRFGEENGPSGKCGVQYYGDRIFDGTVTELEEFPWMALLAYKTAQGIGLACGGVLIQKKYILTAAHCVIGPDVAKLGELVAVRLGEYDTQTLEDCDDTSSAIEENCAPPPVDVYVESSHPHPDYKPGSPERHHDIALIRLSNPVNYTQYVQPICLPTEKQKDVLDNSGTELVICGWGKTEKAEGSGIKLKAKVPVVDENDCKSPYQAKGINLGATQVCAGGGSKDSCRGDSGGPLMFEDRSDPSETRWYAVGVISFGSNPCAKQGVPAVYTRITSYLDWIKSIIKP